MERASYGGVTRTTVFVALFAGALMLVPGLMIGDHDLNPAGSASAVGTNRVLRVGWPDFVGSVITLNPHTMTMGQEYTIILPCYSFLLVRDDKDKITGDLATKWTVSPDGKTYHVWIVQSATFYDKYRVAQSLPLMPLTVDDVMFSFWLTQNNTGSINNYYLPELPGTGGGLIEEMVKFNSYEMEFRLRASFNPFLQALMGVPIVPEYIWENKAWDWNNEGDNNNPCVGSGFFYYGLNSKRAITTVGQAELYANPYWHGTIEYGWQSHVYKFILRSETQSSGIINYDAGNLDVLIAPTPTQFNAQSETGSYKVSDDQGFVLDVCINQLSEQDRIDYGIGGPTDWNNQLLLDPIVKKALKMAMNKTAVVEFSLEGQGAVADSLIPSMNPYVYHYGKEGVPGEVAIPDNGTRTGARQMLMDAGWKYRSTSPYAELVPADSDYWTYAPLAKAGGSEILSFRYAYCDWYDFIMNEGPRYQGWAAEAGIKLVGGPASNNVMGTLWYTADYDVYLWDWWFSPTSEASLDCMEVMTSAAIGGSSDVNDHNATFDEWYYRSLQEPSADNRMVILANMQRWAYENSGYWPVAYRNVLYLAHDEPWGSPTKNPVWKNWGDWETNYPMCVDSTAVWLFAWLSPWDSADNQAPTFQSLNVDPEGVVGESLNAQGAYSDELPLEYRWVWGDGTSTEYGSANGSMTHTFTHDGYYDVHFMVREVGGPDGFICYNTTKVKIIDTGNYLPYNLDFTWDPIDPDSGTVVTFSGTATDPIDPLAFSWDFGDGWGGLGQSTTHQFVAGAGLYNVKMYVDDGRLGEDPRPAFISNTTQVTLNTPPLISVRDEPSVTFGSPYTFRITAKDDNSRDNLKYWWDWGDGSFNLTTTKTCDHQYKFVKDYALTVWADDGTGITSPAHNVSDTGAVHVYKGTNAAPYLDSYYVSDDTPTNEQTVTFYALVIDDDGDIAQVVFDFGDGSPTVAVDQLLPNETVSADHLYLASGEYFPSLTYTDFTVSPIQEYSDTFGWWMTVSRASFALNLVTGWNFVTVPRTGEGYTANTLGLVNDSIVSSWNPLTKLYDKNYIVGKSLPIKNFTIEPSTSYWIYVPANIALNLFGTIPTWLQSRSVDVPAVGGWVNFGFNSLNATWKASDVPGMFSGGVGSVTLVSRYDKANETYKTYTVGKPFTDYTLAPGWGIWVWCTDDGTFSYMP